MRADTTSGRAVGFLLDLIDAAEADRVRTRVGLPRPAPEDPREARRRASWGLPALPSSVVLWARALTSWVSRTSAGSRAPSRADQEFSGDGSGSSPA
ncbi:MAG: hypothetical protein JF597_10240 [Streptomyces sp.]|uniref:hypothetical protein n=1 Tax=Streptomyces sp. TaxID=1931 RepID=UPI0025D0C50B|nr:hypothetical protein [Streptomyces sp.]MBW8793949.1 hypothetical protein [Streptomyces sp.]